MRYLLLLSLCAIVGCGSSGPYDYIPISGRVAYEDGTPIPGIRLQFVAEDAPAIDGAVPRPASATVDGAGQFDVVTSYKYGDGLIPGKHRVVIEAGKNSQGEPIVPSEYTRLTTTPLVVDTADAPLEITVPRPR